jgi:hypothetical protein
MLFLGDVLERLTVVSLAFQQRSRFLRRLLRSIQLTGLSVPGCFPWYQVLRPRGTHHDDDTGHSLCRLWYRHSAASVMGIDPRAIVLCGGCDQSHTFLRDQFQCAVAGRSREDYGDRGTDRLFDPALPVDSQQPASRPGLGLKQRPVRGTFNETAAWADQSHNEHIVTASGR